MGGVVGGSQLIRILLIEDNASDVAIAREGLIESGFTSDLHVARDGEEAINALFGGPDGDVLALRPDLVFLDLNLPRVSGLEVLERIKTDEALRGTPVIVLSGSSRDEDISNSYNSGANTYIQKPFEFEVFVRLLEVIREYWTVFAKLPPLMGGPVPLRPISPQLGPMP
jgi:CheY-like chemotaxis protein